MRLRHAASFVAAAALVVGPPAVLISKAVTTPSRTATPPPSGDSATSAPIGYPSGSLSLAAQPRQLVVPYVFVVASAPLSASQVDVIGRIPGVRTALAVDGGQVDINGQAANVLGVPDEFRSWTPPVIATATGVWTALSDGDLVVTQDAANHHGLTLGESYLVGGALTLNVPFTAIASSGLPNVDAIVNKQRSAQLGLARNIAVLISAPGASYDALVQRLHAVAGAKIQVINLVPVQRSSALPIAAATPGTPTTWIQLYRDSAAMYCPGLSWTVLAAIGQIESGHGTNDGPSSAGALGPMQFLPSTWAQWGITGFGRTGSPDIMNPLDAVPSAARMLCADGATQGLAGLRAAIWDYNHADWYVNEVLQLAEEYAHDYP